MFEHIRTSVCGDLFPSNSFCCEVLKHRL